MTLAKTALYLLAAKALVVLVAVVVVRVVDAGALLRVI